mgnify:FL=1
MADVATYFTPDGNTYAAQGIVLYKFDASKSAAFLQEMLVPLREVFLSEEKIARNMEKYNRSRQQVISDHVPEDPTIMSGDFGEALTYYIAKRFFAHKANVPPMKLRFKGDPNRPMPHTDIVFFYIDDMDTPSANDIIYTIEVKSRKKRPSRDEKKNTILSAIAGAELDKSSRLMKTIRYFVKKIQDEQEPEQLFKEVERFKDVYFFDKSTKIHSAVAVVEEIFI